MKRLAFMLVAGASLAFGGAVLAQQGKPASAAQVAAAVQKQFPVAASISKSPDETVYLARCQYCHVEMGMGTLTIAKRLGPDKALLADRKDLTGDYIRAVVRHGFSTMPAISRAEVSDPELDAIVRFLTRNNPAETRKK